MFHSFKMNSRLAAVAFGALAIGTVALSASAAAAPLPLFPFFMTPPTEAAPPPVQMAPSVFSSAASAQVLGYASTQPNAFPSDEVMGEPQGVVPERLRRAVVALNTTEAPGTIVIDTGNTALYYVLGQGRAIRYGVGVGREGFTWSGVQTISRKAEWPDWHPPAEMIARQPYLPRFIARAPRGLPGPPAMKRGR